MEEQQAQPEQPAAEPTQQAEQPLVTKVSQFKNVPTPVTDDVKFDVTDINKIEDPKAREYAEKAYKSFQRGFDKKFQEVATLRKQLESERSTPWTPERVQSLLNDQNFVSAAQKVAGVNPQQQTDDYSALSESEKKRIADIERQAQTVAQQNAQLLRQQQDEALKNKYANYAPDIVDVTTQKLLRGEIQATREDLWKVVDYEDAVQRAYELGKKDGRGETAEEVPALSVQGIQAASGREHIAPANGESNRDFFKRLVFDNLKKSTQTR